MDAPQEGRAGGTRPPPSGSGRGGRGGGGEASASRERQAFLPGLGGAEDGWTVFGPEDDEGGPGEDLPLAAGAVPAADPADRAPAEEPAGEPTRTQEGQRQAEEPDPDPSPPQRAGTSGATPEAAAAPQAAPVRSSPVARPANAVSGGGRPGVEVPAPVARARLTLPWAIVLMAALATAAATVLVAHLRGGGTVVAGEGDEGGGAGEEVLAGLEPRTSGPTEVDPLESQVEALREELERARAEAGESQRLRDELEATRAQLAERLASVESGLGAVRDRIEEREPSGEPPPASAPASEGSAGSADAFAEVPQPSAPPAQEPPEQRRARGVERVLAALESGRPSEALSQLESLRAQGLFPPEEPAGSDLLLALARGWLALESAGRASPAGDALPDAARVAEAGEHLGRAERLREGFETSAAAWLSAGQGPSALPERLARVDRSLAQLGEQLAATRAGVAAVHEQDWRWILDLGVPQDPGLVSRHVERFGCDHDAVLLASTVDAWLAHCVWSGEVDPLELASAQHLRDWGARTATRAPQPRSARELEVLWLWYALRWYVDGDDPAAFDWRGLDVPEVLAPRDDWRAELRLAIELARPAAGWPPPQGRLAIYHVEGPGPARWRVDQVEQVERDATLWRLVRRHYAADGAALGGGVQVTLERTGQRFAYAGSATALIDLRASGPPVSVAPCPVAAPRALPAMKGVDLFEVESLVLGTGQAVGTCLVQRDGEWTRWLLPGLGLVREERDGPDGRVRIELCAVGSAP